MNNVENSVEKVKPYTLRPLYDEELYTILDIIEKLCPEDIRPIFIKAMEKFTKKEAEAGDDKDMLEKLANDFGMDVVMELGLVIIRNMKNVKDDVYALLSDLSGIPADQIRKMPFGTTPKMIMDVVKDERNRDFFGE
jgi:hypothetical protein